MTKPPLLTALAGSLLVTGLAASFALAQGTTRAATQPPRGTQGIALLDISYIFENLTRFKAQMADMRADVEQAEVQMKKERDTLRKLQDQLKGYPAGSPEYKQMEEHLTKRMAEMQVQMQLQRKEFLHREAKIYYNVYQEIQQEVNYYATNSGVSAVLRFSGDPVDKEKPDEVLKEINKPVIWYSQSMDITPVILRRLNDRYNIPSTTDGRGRPGVPGPY